MIVVSSQSERQDVFKALDLGAIDFIAKPARARSSDLYSIQNDLVAKVLESAKLSGEKIKRRLEFTEGPTTVNAPSRYPVGHKSTALLIGCSTGGPPALHHILTSLKEKLPVPVVVAQHMPPGFTKSFAQRLNEYSVMDVKEAEEGDQLLPGWVYICPGSMNIELQHYAGVVRIRIVGPPPNRSTHHQPMCCSALPPTFTAPRR